jgi:hypothetical protein
MRPPANRPGGRAALPVLLAGLLAAGAAPGAEIVPSLSLTGVYSDNVTIAPKGLEEEDFIGIVQPGIRINADGSRYEFVLDYQLQGIFYADQEDADEAYSIGQANLKLELLPERFTLTGDARISQIVVDPQARVPNSNLPVIGNRQDVAALRLVPEWQERILGNDLVIQGTVGEILFSDDALQDVSFLELRNSYATPERDRGLSFRLRHEYQNYDYEVVEIKRQLAELALYLELGGGWAPFVAGGVESDFATPTDASMDVGTWQAGLRRNTERSRIELSFGERSFGSNLRVLLERTLGDDSGDFIRVSYAENPRTVEELAAVTVPPTAGGPPPQTDPGLPPDLPPELFPPGTGDTFLQRRSEIAAGWSFNRLDIRFTLFDQDNDRITAGDSPDTLNQQNNQTGGTVVASYSLGQRFRVFGNLRIADRTFESAGVTTSADTLTTGRLGVSYDLGSRTTISGWVGTQRRTNVEDDGAPDPELLGFEENQIALSVARTFL